MAPDAIAVAASWTREFAAARSRNEEVAAIVREGLLGCYKVE